MPLTLPQLAIAALVVVLIISLAVMARRKRKMKGPALDSMPGQAEAAPAAPARRRQLQSFVDTEWDTPPEPMPEATAAPQSGPEPEPEPFAPLVADFTPVAAEPFAEPLPPAPVEAESEHVPAALPDYDQAVLGRLEEAFEALQAGEITLDTYRERILAEEAAVDRRVAMLEAEGDSADLQAALVAQESVRWCLDWANDQDDTSSS